MVSYVPYFFIQNSADFMYIQTCKSLIICKYISKFTVYVSVHRKYIPIQGEHKVFTYYIHLLQEKYVEYKHIFFYYYLS